MIFVEHFDSLNTKFVLFYVFFSSFELFQILIPYNLTIFKLCFKLARLFQKHSHFSKFNNHFKQEIRIETEDFQFEQRQID